MSHPLQRFLSRLFCFLVATAMGPSCVASAIFGVVDIALEGGGKRTWFSFPFLPQKALQARVWQANGMNLILDGPPPESLVDGDYVEILSGRGAGRLVEIVRKRGRVLMLEKRISSLVKRGDLVAVRRFATMDSLFGPDNRFGFAASTDGGPEGADRLYVVDGKSGAVRENYFVSMNGRLGWHDAVTGSPTGGTPIHPFSAFFAWIGGESVTITALGEVSDHAPILPVRRGLNVLTVFGTLDSPEASPAEGILTLGTSGLHTGDPGTGIAGIPGLAWNKGDLVLVPRRQQPGEFDTYFFNEAYGWLDAATAEPANDRPLQVGSAIVILRESPSSFEWTRKDS